MKKNRIKAYWLLLLVLLYTAAAVLSVGEAQARYVTTATWNTVVQKEEAGVTSDCLEDVSAAPLTILLGIMPQEPCEVTFSLTAREAASGKLNWTVDLPEYISVEMRIGDTVITPETTIDMEAEETVTVAMLLIPSETAFTEVRDAVNVSVTVTWADTLKGTFLTQLPAVEEEEEPTEETEPPTEETQPDPTEPTPTEPTPTEPANPTEPTPTEPTNPTEPDPTEPTSTEPANPTEPGADPSGLRRAEHSCKTVEKPDERLNTNTETPPEEEPTEAPPETEPEPSEDPDGQSEDTTDPSEPAPPADEGETEPTQPTDPTEPSEPVQEDVPILLEAVNSVNPAGSLPIQITAPENGGPIHLGIASVVESADPEGESQTVLENFPRYTRFSLTTGESYFMLYNPDVIALNLEAGETLSVLLDLSHVNLGQSQLVLGAAPRNGEAGISICTATVIPESTQYVTLSSRILSAGMPLEITVSDCWKDYSLEYTVEMLTTVKSEDGKTETLTYMPVELPEDCLCSVVTSDENGTKLVFSIGKTLPPAGTYRVSLNWTFEEICYAQTQETFFINYSLYTESEKTGGAEQ